MGTWKKIAYFDDIAATKLDAFAAPDDGTNLDASNARHGLLKKLIDDTTKFLRSDGGWQVPAGAALTSKIITSTRNLADLSGDVAYTGVGFVPTVILALAVLPGSSTLVSWGLSDSGKTSACIYFYNSAKVNGRANIFALHDGSTTSDVTVKGQIAIVKTYDADGFTLTWTKAGTPTGTSNLYCLCLK